MRWVATCTNPKCRKKPFLVKAPGGTVYCPRCGSSCKLASFSERDGGFWTKEPLIIQKPLEGLYPLSEFHARLEGTTPFVMTEETNWNTYVRSDQSRYGKQQRFTPSFVEKPKSFLGFGAKTGTYGNVLSRPELKKKLLLEEKKGERPRLVVQSGFVYDALLSYRVAACRYIGDKLEWAVCRYEIVSNSDNDYPCLIVAAPGGPTIRDVSNGGKLETNKKYWCRFVMSAFVGIVDRNAWSRGIPIELTMRSSFSFLAPSVAEVGASFRINVGIVPAEYMNILAESIVELYELFSDSFTKRLREEQPSKNFGGIAKEYNKAKRKVFEKRQREYEEYLEDERKLQEESSDDLDEPRIERKPRKKVAKPREPVLLDQNVGTAWDMLFTAGDSSGKTVLTQVTDRSHVNLEQLSDLALRSDEKLIEGTVKVPDRFVLKRESISLKPPKLLPLQSFSAYSPKGQKLIVDREFWSMIQLLVSALDAPFEEFAQFYDPRERWGHVGGLYAFLDRLNVDFIRAYAPRFLDDDDGDASESDEDDDLEVGGRPELGVHGKDQRFGRLEDDEVEERPGKKVHVYSKKHITATGMRSIHLAHHCCRVYAGERGVAVTKVKVSANRMYYETEEAIEKVPIKKVLPTKSEKLQQDNMGAASILFFDLNHCNALQDENPRVAFEEFDLIVLDHTSATTSRVHFYLKEAFRHERVRVVLLVTSGLKNEQSGSDLNTYGTLRIVARSREERDRLFQEVEGVDLLESGKRYEHPKESHAVRRAYKHFGFVPKTKDFLRPGFTAPLRTEEPNLFRYDARGVGTVTFEVCDVPADGDCLFTAIGGVTTGVLDPAPVRKKVCELLEGHAELLPNGMDLQVGLGFSTKRVDSKIEYLRAMAEPLVWGGMTEIQAFSYTTPVVVFETARQPVYFRNGIETRTEDIDWRNLPRNTIYLAFYGNHYAALVRRT